MQKIELMIKWVENKAHPTQHNYQLNASELSNIWKKKNLFQTYRLSNLNVLHLLSIKTSDKKKLLKNKKRRTLERKKEEG